MGQSTFPFVDGRAGRGPRPGLRLGSSLGRAAALTALGLASALALPPPPVAAQDGRPECVEAPEDAEVRARLRTVLRYVREQEPPIRRWFTSFLLLHGSMASGAAIIAAASRDEGPRNEMLVGMTGSALAIATLAIFSPPLMGAGDGLRAYPETTPEERLRKLRAAEDVLRRASNSVDFLHGWFPATATSLYVSAASALVLLAFERVTFAYTHVIGGSLLGLGRVLLRPTAARTLYRRYRRRYPDAACAPVASSEVPVSWRVHSFGLGVGLTVEF